MLKILNAEIAREAIAVKNSTIAYLRERVEQGSCCHGKFTAGYDMENACWTCEDEGSHTLEQQGYDAALAYISEKRQRALGDYLISVAQFERDPLAIARNALYAVSLYKDGRYF
jgi:hypothetical protein